MIAIRVQFSCHGVLVAECIVQDDQVDSTTARFFRAKDAKRLPCGGAITYRADMPRYFDVPVGSAISKGR